MSKNKSKKPYKSPELRVYGPMSASTRAAMVGIYPDGMGGITFSKKWWAMMMMMVMS